MCVCLLVCRCSVRVKFCERVCVYGGGLSVCVIVCVRVLAWCVSVCAGVCQCVCMCACV